MNYHNKYDDIMVGDIDTKKYPVRKYNFKNLMDELCSQGGSCKGANLCSLLEDSSSDEDGIHILFKDPERWGKFQSDYQGEFEDKIKLMDKIRDRKKENEPLNWINAARDPKIKVAALGK